MITTGTRIDPQRISKCDLNGNAKGIPGGHLAEIQVNANILHIQGALEKMALWGAPKKNGTLEKAKK